MYSIVINEKASVSENHETWKAQKSRDIYMQEFRTGFSQNELTASAKSNRNYWNHSHRRQVS